MTRISLYALVPYMFTAIAFGTPYFDYIILTISLISIINFIRRKNIASSAIALVFTALACLICSNTVSMCNKSFYALIDKPIVLKCVVDETPVYYDGKIKFTARMLSATSQGKSTQLDDKVLVYISGDDVNISYGDLLDIKTKLTLPNSELNTGGFSYNRYLQSLGIQTLCRANSYSVVHHGSYEKVNPVILKIFNLRQMLLDKCDRYFDADTSAFLKALLLGYKADMSDEMQSAVTRSGISHIVSISGMHLSILIIILNILIQRLKFRGSMYITPVLNILCALFITALTGFSPSVKRAAAMLIISNISSLVYRENDTLQSLSFAVLILLIANPAAVHDVRLILSAASVLGIVILNQRIERRLLKLIKFENLRKTISITLSAQIISIPFSIMYFNTVSVLGIVTNIIVLPLIPYLMGMGVAFFFSFFNILSNFLSDGIWLLTKLVLIVADSIAAIPFAQVEVGFKKFVYISFLCAAIVYFIRKTVYCRVFRKNFICFAIACTAVVMIFFPPRSPDVNITVINVGQGDCTLIEFPNGKTMLVDGGGNPTLNYDTAERIIRPYLIQNCIERIDYAVISHFHSDHSDGILNLAKIFPVGCIIAPEYMKVATNENVIKAFNVCKNYDIPLYLMSAGDKFYPDDGISFTVYHPDDKYIYDENDASMVFKISAFGKSVLFTGDIERMGRYTIARKNPEIKSDLLKAPHHGDYSAADEKFLTAVDPDMIYACVGKNNTYGHPSEKSLKLYAKNDIRLFRTDFDGTIKFKITPKGQLETE